MTCFTVFYDSKNFAMENYVNFSLAMFWSNGRIRHHEKRTAKLPAAIPAKTGARNRRSEPAESGSNDRRFLRHDQQVGIRAVSAAGSAYQFHRGDLQFGTKANC